MININYGHNKELLDKCKPLCEYSFFVDQIRNCTDNCKKEGIDYTLEDIIDRVIDELPKDFEILEFMMKNRREVKDMCLLEYDQERHMREQREEGLEDGIIIGRKKGREEGREEGIKEGREEGIKEGREEGIKEGREEGIKIGIEEGRIRLLVKFVNEGILTVEKASEEASMTAGEFEKMLKG